MNQTFYRTIICDCGHIGKMKFEETGAAGTDSYRVLYDAENFVGEAMSSPILLTFDKVMEIMNPTCPQCEAGVNARHYL